jgi:hypothetical protein
MAEQVLVLRNRTRAGLDGHVFESEARMLAWMAQPWAVPDGYFVLKSVWPADADVAEDFTSL